MTITQLQRQIIDFLTERLRRESSDYPGLILDYDRAIDDGHYADPHMKMRPEFVKEDESGWINSDNSGAGFRR